LEATGKRFQREQAFLVSIAPLLSSPVSKQKMLARWDEVVAAVQGCELAKPSSLVVIAALSSVVVPNGGPAKALLKLRAKYTEVHAYNALTDLRALEYLMCCYSMLPEKPMQLWTKDKRLGWFWCGIQASDFNFDGKAARFKLSPQPELFPGWAFDELSAVISNMG
jgi:hypothetical protein